MYKFYIKKHHYKVMSFKNLMRINCASKLHITIITINGTTDVSPISPTSGDNNPPTRNCINPKIEDALPAPCF